MGLVQIVSSGSRDEREAKHVESPTIQCECLCRFEAEHWTKRVVTVTVYVAGILSGIGIRFLIWG